jgi:uncharacterized protein YecE (DUF72 family)
MVNSGLAKIRIGCSGWIYAHWRGRFYPEKLAVKRWFAFYAEHFDTVEINNSFYRLPKAETFDAWREQAPPGFCYAVKANRFLTQAKKLKDCEEPLERMMTPFRHLKPALGPILYQLPPRFRINLERLESFLQLLPKDVINISNFGTKAGTLTKFSRCLTDMERASARTTCPDQRARGSRPARQPMSASTAARENIGAAIPTSACSTGPTGCSTKRGTAVRSGPISTTTPRRTPSTTRRR